MNSMNSFQRQFAIMLAVGGVMAVMTCAGNAAVTRINAGDFTPAATAIPFNNPISTTNPTFNFTSVPNLGTVNVSFGGHFLGQTTSGGSVVTLSDSDPSGLLALDPSAPDTFVTNDSANPTSPVLSGTPRFNGPISGFFDTPVNAIGLDGGFFDAVNSTTIEAYDASGNILGSVTNNGTGIEFFGLRDTSGANTISGFSFFITGNEGAGFAIDNVTFGTASELQVIPSPSAATAGLFVMLGGLAMRRRSRRHA